MTHPSTLYRIVSRSDWQRAQARGTFEGTEHDLRDGFIHFSTADQVHETAAKHYAGKQDLLLLFVAAEALLSLGAGALRWEVSRGGALFPHLYAALPVALVARVEPLPLDAQGEHQFPPLEP